MEKNQLINRPEVVIIGGSAGSLEVLLQILPRLIVPVAFSIVIVLHRKAGDDTLLEDLIAVKSAVPLKEVEDKTPLLPGFVYIAPSDYHLLFEKNRELALDASEKINFSRPSIDVAFESVADIFGTDLIGILLSGANSDGTAGLIAIQNAGGVVVVQKPETAEMAYMPQNAIENLTPDYILTAAEILAFINNFSI